jgi:hypothetical protein
MMHVMLCCAGVAQVAQLEIEVFGSSPVWWNRAGLR